MRGMRVLRYVSRIRRKRVGGNLAKMCVSTDPRRVIAIKQCETLVHESYEIGANQPMQSASFVGLDGTA